MLSTKVCFFNEDKVFVYKLLAFSFISANEAENFNSGDKIALAFGKSISTPSPASPNNVKGLIGNFEELDSSCVIIKLKEGPAEKYGATFFCENLKIRGRDAFIEVVSIFKVSMWRSPVDVFLSYMISPLSNARLNKGRNATVSLKFIWQISPRSNLVPLLVVIPFRLSL